VGYNSDNPTAKFDGVMLDVEPGSNPDFPALLDLYQCQQQQANANGLGLSAAISAFWNTQTRFNLVGLNTDNPATSGDEQRGAIRIQCGQRHGSIVRRFCNEQLPGFVFERAVARLARDQPSGFSCGSAVLGGRDHPWREPCN
jgi:hypothetical protein